MITYKGRQIPETFEEIVDPRHTALIVHELLNDFVSEGGAFDKLGIRVDISNILPPILRLIDAARSRGIRLVYMRYTNHADFSNYSEPMISRRYDSMMDPSKPLPVVEGTWGWDNIPEVAPREGDVVMKKLRVDCFLQTQLDMMLRSNGIRTFVIAGIGSEVGIVPTVSHGQNLGYYCVAPEDCLEPTSPPNAEVAKRFIGRYASMNPSSEILKVWGL